MSNIISECTICAGKGWYADHDPYCRGDCSPGCPIQVQCDKCYGTGNLEYNRNARLDTLKQETGAHDVKFLDDGRTAYLYQTITAWRILAEGPDCPSEEWMLAAPPNTSLAQRVFNLWDGYNEPSIWIRHKVGNQTRRRDLQTKAVWISDD